MPCSRPSTAKPASALRRTDPRVTTDLRDRAYLELSLEGRVGEAGAAVVTAVVAQVAGARRPRASYPTMDETWEWDDVAIIDAVHEFVVYLNDENRFDALVATAVDGRTLEKGLYVRCVSWFKDRAKATDEGAFDRKLDRALAGGKQAGSIAEIPVAGSAAWHRVQDPPEIYGGPDQSLLRAAHATPIKRLRWTSSDRRDPITDSASLLRVCLAAMAAVAMAVLTDTLRRVSLHRLGLDLRADDALHDHLEAATDVPAQDAVVVEHVAAEVAGKTSDTHLRVLAIASDDASPEAVASTLGVGRTKASEMKKEAISALQGYLRDTVDDDPDLAHAVAARVLGLARLRFSRPETEASSSAPHGGDL